MPLPQALLDRLATQFGPAATAAMLKAMATDRQPTFRVNTLRATDESVMAVLRVEAIQFERVKNVAHAFKIKNRTDKQLLEHPLAQNGHIYLQGLTSMLPPIVLDPQPGETVLDLCAAPGSKTSQIAAMMQNHGRVVACEENSIRYQKLCNTMQMQGATIVDARNVDATLLHHEMPEAFDKVLADVPCSAEGRMDSRDKRSFSFWSEKNIIAHAKLQRRLLRSAVQCLKPGGVLVYSTCTLAPEENEEMIAWLLTEFQNMKPVDIMLPFSGKTNKNKSITLLPTTEYEGFFVAKLQKM